MNTEWFKSSRSGESACLQARWAKSSHSLANGSCAEARWVKSGYSGASNCPEARQHDGMVEIRDSEDPDGPVLAWSPAAWARFLASLR